MMKSNQDFEQALRLQQQGEYERASMLYECLIKEDPKRMVVWGYLALTYLESGRPTKALETLQEALRRAPNEIHLHMHAAHVHKSMQDTCQAMHHYQRVLEINPKYAKAHNNLAAEYAVQNNYSLALQHYRHALHADPSLVPAHMNLGLLLLKRGELVSSETQFQNVLALDPEHTSARFYLGLLQIQTNHLEEADVTLCILLSKNPEYIDAWVNRGVIALKQGHEQQAIDHFTQALILDNHHLEARNNLAATFIHFDRYEPALQYYDKLLRDDPNNIEYLYNSGIAQMGLGHIQIAVTLFQKILNLDEEHFGALSNLAAIQMRLGHKTLACELLERALTINPQDATSRFMLQGLRGETNQQEACPEYVHDLFNHYALYYDKHMEQNLQYAVPTRLWTLLQKRQTLIYPQGLDLGCGTGLSGMVLRPLCKHLTGVDLSEKMLAIAREKKIYDDLIPAELLHFLQANTQSFDLIVAADVLPYFGDLEALFKAIKSRMAPHAVFWFTTEISQEASWALQSSIRFCHHPQYIHVLCQQLGLTVSHQETMVARKQDEKDLFVNLYALKKSF